MTTIRKITHILTLIFAVITLLSVPPARADFTTGSYTIWIESGRAMHSFEIVNPTGDSTYYGWNMGMAVAFDQQTSHYRITGSMTPGYQNLILRDNTSGEIASLPNDANGETTIVGSAWTSESGNPIPKLYFLGDAALASSSIVVSQNGSFYIPSIESTMWAQYLQADLYAFSSPYDPNLPYRILNLTTGQQSAESANDTTLSAWTWITTPAPLASVTIWLCDMAEAGHWFTIHGRYPDGPEMLTRVQATDGTGNIYVHLTATIGMGMDFQIERDADHLTIGGMHVDTNFPQQDFNIFTYGNFPSTPNRPLAAQPFSFASDVLGSYGFTLWLADGYHTEIPATLNPISSLTGRSCSWEMAPLYDDYGLPISNAYSLNIFLDVDPQQSSWIVNKNTGETYPIGQSEILGSYENFHLNPPPSDTSTLTLNIHQTRGNNELQLAFSYPDGNTASILIPAMNWSANGCQITYPNHTTAGTSLSPTSGTFPFINPDTLEAYTLTGLSVTIPNPSPYQWPTSITISDTATSDYFTDNSRTFSPTPTNNLLDWRMDLNPTAFQISSSRWGHDLVVQFADGREFPVQASSTEGDYSIAWANSYYDFLATALTTTEPQWRVVDKSTDEMAPDYQQNLINWIAVAEPIAQSATILPGIVGPATFRWTAGPGTPAGGKFIVEHHASYADGHWADAGEIPVPTGDLVATDHVHSLDVGTDYEGDTIGFRVYYEYGNRKSKASHPTFIQIPADYDHDGIPDSIDLDKDDDGIPDADELAWGLNPYDRNDADGDDDQDGISNSDEILAGTDPHDPFNGHIPNIQIISGDNQHVPPLHATPLPMKIRCTTPDGTPMKGLYIEINVPDDGRAHVSLKQTKNIDKTEWDHPTDDNGEIEFWLLAPSEDGPHPITILCKQYALLKNQNPLLPQPTPAQYLLGKRYSTTATLITDKSLSPGNVTNLRIVHDVETKEKWLAWNLPTAPLPQDTFIEIYVSFDRINWHRETFLPATATDWPITKVYPPDTVTYRVDMVKGNQL